MAASSSTDMEGISEVVMAEDCLLMIGSALKPCIKNAAPGSIPECTRNVTMIFAPAGTPALPRLTGMFQSGYVQGGGPTNDEIKAFVQHTIGAGLIMAQENIGAHRSKKSPTGEMSLGERAIIARGAFIATFSPTRNGGLKLNTASSNLGGVGVLGAQPFIFGKRSSLTPTALDLGGRMDVKTSGAEHVAEYGGWDGAVDEAKRQHREFLAREAVKAVLDAPSDKEAAEAAAEAKRVSEKTRQHGLKSQAEEAADEALKAAKEEEVAAMGFTADNLRDYMTLCDLEGSSPKASWPGHAAIDARDCAVTKAWSKQQLQAYKEHPYLLHHLAIELENIGAGLANKYSLVENCPPTEKAGLPPSKAANRARALACACKHPQMGQMRF